MRTGAVEASGLSLAYAERGEGVPVLLLHGTAVARELWREVVGELGDEPRSIAFDRRAYGASGAPDPYLGTTVGEQAEDAAAVLGALEATQAVVCGHELGALIALDLLRRHRPLVRGAVLVEPPLLALSRDGPATMSELRTAIEQGARTAENASAGAVDAYLEEVTGPRFSELLGEDRLAAARAAGRAFAADVAAGPTFAFSRRELRAIDPPVVVVSGRESAPVRRGVARSLAGLLADGSLNEPECGHLVPIEAPGAVVQAIREVAAR